MAFNTTSGRVEYTSSIGQSIFTFLFKIYEDTDIKVYQTPSGGTPNDTTDLLTINTDYTVAVDGDNGGSVTLTTATISTDAITIQRQLPTDRDYDYQTSGDLLAQTLNDDQNYQTYLIADQEAKESRALTLPDSVQNVSTELPAPEALKLMRWNSSADGLENTTIGDDSVFINIYNVDSIAELITLNPLIYSTVNVKGYYAANDGGGGIFNYDSSQSAVNNGGTIIDGWARQYAGAINAKMFGVYGDGTTDDTDAIKNAISVAGDGVLEFNDGDYVVTEELLIANRITIIGSNKERCRFFFKGTPAKVARTYKDWQSDYDSGVYTSTIDTARASGFVVTVADVVFRGFNVFGWYDATVVHTTPFVSYPLSSDWDIGVYCSAKNFTADIKVTGLFNYAGLLVDVTQPNGSTDGMSLYNSEAHGAYGLRIEGADGQPDGGGFLDMVNDDVRGAGGASDFNATACFFSGIDIYVNTDLGSRLMRTDSGSRGGMKISGQLSRNTAKAIQGFRLYATRISSSDKDMFNLNYANRVEFIGCHTEYRSGSYDIDGTTLLTSVDFNGLVSTDKTTNIKFIGGNKSGEPDNLVYASATKTLVYKINYGEPIDDEVETILGTSKDKGSWTPTFNGSTASGTPVYANQVGTYNRIGDLVTITARVSLSALGGLTGNVSIEGLPYSLKSNQQLTGVVFSRIENLVLVDIMMTGYIAAGNSKIELVKFRNGASATTITDSSMTDTTAIFFSMSYITDDVTLI